MIAVNWNKEDDMTNVFWRQNISQMWVESEFKVSKDLSSWSGLTEDEQDTFKKGEGPGENGPRCQCIP